jgi:hypothetical protein
MKALVAVFVAGWVGWVSTAKWEEVDVWEEDTSTAAVSTKGKLVPVKEELIQPLAGQDQPRLRDILLGPPAPSWHDLREETIR